MIEALGIGVIVGLLVCVPSGILGYWLCVRFLYGAHDRELVYAVHPWLNVSTWTIRR